MKLEVHKEDQLIQELSGSNNQWINTVVWGMTQSKPRMEEEMKEWEEEQRFIELEDEFFDYYDTVEIFPLSDEEVDKNGRSLRTRLHPLSGLTDKQFRYTRVPPGEYKIRMSVEDITLSKKVVILEDSWYDK